ncbi:hypothetical protein VTL71DRAFT_4818 [Oculimacula yallundae]|uniref:Uncharacterized protein n=1 Tax=Oculimacula yallundae TaxID=86028 RepID=A0ABR4C4T4_9HELO
MADARPIGHAGVGIHDAPAAGKKERLKVAEDHFPVNTKVILAKGDEWLTLYIAGPPREDDDQDMKFRFCLKKDTQDRDVPGQPINWHERDTFYSEGLNDGEFQRAPLES